MSTIDDLLFRSGSQDRPSARRAAADQAAVPGGVRGLALAMMLGSLAWVAAGALVLG